MKGAPVIPYVLIPTEGRPCVACGVGPYRGGRCASCGHPVAPFARVLHAPAGADVPRASDHPRRIQLS